MPNTFRIALTLQPETVAGLQQLGLQASFPANLQSILFLSALTTAILFQPLRHRIQQLIDRRFYRSKYDTVRIVESFSEAMSEEVDLTQLTEQLLSVVQETMHPTFVSLWLRKSENQQHKRVTRVLPKIDEQIDVY